MKDRRSEYDVTDKVKVSDTASVRDEVLAIFRDVYPKFDESTLKQAFEDCNDLFDGRYLTYLPCDTLYHDKQHTLDMTLAHARLINGHEQTATPSDRFGPDRAVIGIIAALYHDSGYLRHEHDQQHHNGAEYTVTHVSRSAAFLKQYMLTAKLGEQAQLSANMVHYTGYEMHPDQIQLPDEKTHQIGHMLGTADLIAQMSDRCYLEKCRDRLYTEFVLAGIAIQVDKAGNECVVYESGEDLLRKTPAFYGTEVEIRLNQLFNKSYNYEKVFFGGKSEYILALGINQSRIKKVLRENDFGQLNRIPPENYGTRTFPGLDVYLNEHPQQKLLHTGAVASI